MKALSGNDRLSPLAPRLQVKDPSDEWVTVIEDLGLPSGIDRTFVADLTGIFLSPDRRVRVVTNFAVYWDRAAFALPASDAGIATGALVHRGRLTLPGGSPKSCASGESRSATTTRGCFPRRPGMS